MAFFIPWRVVAEESGAAHFGFGGAMLPDLLGPMVRPPAAPSISTLVIFRFGATMELGRSGRPMMMPRRFGAARATGSASPRPDRNSSLGAPACFLSGISGWRDGVLCPLAGGSRRIRRGAFWLRRRDALLDLLAARW
jgi:hypothetical protein